MSAHLADLSSSLLSVLECPVCFMYMSSPIRQCRNGHNICSECIKKVHSCPTCRSEFIETRNHPLEEIASKMEFPCEFKGQGCPVTLKFEELKKHNKVCTYGNRRCAVRMCKWRGSVTNLMDHVVTDHPTQLMQNDAGYHMALVTWDWLSSKTNGWMVFLFKDFRELFWVHVKQEVANGKMMMCVQHVTSECTKKFLYEIKLQGQEASSVYWAPAIADTVNTNSVFVSERCFSIPIRALKQFMIDSDVLLKVKVEAL
ncbi:E3 ubiquitin-protein ligase sina-like [Bacillus rossius redtenbacheri]|uniref:E3 ubiquitin-protein ligase sina-like n=1 Tax=Bacillus rossius redtenbacheri TaxID=93214 RepID=UPI002FDD3F72